MKRKVSEILFSYRGCNLFPNWIFNCYELYGLCATVCLDVCDCCCA